MAKEKWIVTYEMSAYEWSSDGGKDFATHEGAEAFVDDLKARAESSGASHLSYAVFRGELLRRCYE